ncbi:MAG: serine hydrolase domain-containing protein [Bacteroidota bacterium]
MRYIILSLLFLLVTYSCQKDSSTNRPTNSEIISDSLKVIRVNLGNTLGEIIPSLNVYIQTPDEIIFATNSHVGEPEITPDTYFRFASNSKNFTSSAILNMMEDGWLSIYDFIIDTIPGMDVPYVPSDEIWSIPYKNQITIEQLLQHSAGVYDVDNGIVPNCDGLSYVNFIMRNNPSHQFNVNELVEQLTINNLSYWEPGFSHHYSNTGYSILSKIISRVYSEHTGQSKTFKDYLYDYVYGPETKVPLAVNFPYLATEMELPNPHALGNVFYSASDGGNIQYNATNMSAHVAEGNGNGTFKDLNTYIRALMTGNNVLDSETVTLMQTDYSPDTSGHSNYALGCINITNIGFGHNGEIRGYLSIMAYDPQYDVSIIVLMNAVDYVNHDDYITNLKGMYEGAWKAREILGYPGKPY